MLEFKCAFKDNGYLNKEKYGKDKHLRLGDEQCLTGSFFFFFVLVERRREVL